MIDENIYLSALKTPCDNTSHQKLTKSVYQHLINSSILISTKFSTDSRVLQDRWIGPLISCKIINGILKLFVINPAILLIPCMNYFLTWLLTSPKLGLTICSKDFLMPWRPLLWTLRSRICWTTKRWWNISSYNNVYRMLHKVKERSYRPRPQRFASRTGSFTTSINSKFGNPATIPRNFEPQQAASTSSTASQQQGFQRRQPPRRQLQFTLVEGSRDLVPLGLLNYSFPFQCG